MRPLIGITMGFEETAPPNVRTRCFLNSAYTDAIFAAGGMPYPLPLPPTPDRALLAEMLSRVDGVLFTGGPDLDPKHYGQARHERTQTLHARRDGFEVEFFLAADASTLPVLSICLGCQLANVGRGGCLVQHVDDLPRSSPIAHHSPDHSSTFHSVRVLPESRLARIVGSLEFEVNSRHHQVIDASQVGGGLRPVAFAPDGIVEAAEDPGDRFLVAVQWHPEDMIDRPVHLRLFQALVAEAARRRK